NDRSRRARRSRAGEPRGVLTGGPGGHRVFTPTSRWGDLSRGVDLGVRGVGGVPDRDDLPADDTEVAGEAGSSGAVDDRSVANLQIVRHRSSWGSCNNKSEFVISNLPHR